MTDLWGDFFEALDEDIFDERPVTVEEFVQSEEYLGLPPLSEHQFELIRRGSQIYYKETLLDLYGEEDGMKRWEETCNEIIMMLGKGSGKDYVSSILCAYICYLLLCLKNPQKYYGKPQGDDIVIMNIAQNAKQADRVFFKNLKDRIKYCPWFEGKFDVVQGEINFDKNIKIVSGHSESESLEGYNVICVVLDEISGFALESSTGNDKATAEGIYKMHSQSVVSRFADFGKIISLSFPRFKGDFISQRYEKVIAEKETIMREHTFKRDPELSNGIPGNEFTIEWEEDHIVRYKYPKTYALRRPSWEVNPTKKIEDYTRAFDDDPGDSLTRFACMPTANTDNAFFKNHDALERAFISSNGVDQEGVFLDTFIPDPQKEYFVHVDLAQKHDRCVVVMSHVNRWDRVSIGGDYEEVHPHVQVDAIRWWQPSKDKHVDFDDVVNYILALRRRGFNLKLVTFDRWNSISTRNNLESQGIKTDLLSVRNDQYEDFKVMVYDGRLIGPAIPELLEELKALMWIKNKVDHPRGGFNDLSDGVAGSIYNSVKHTLKPTSFDVHVESYEDVAIKEAEEREMQNNIIASPKRKSMPDKFKGLLERMS